MPTSSESCPILPQATAGNRTRRGSKRSHEVVLLATDQMDSAVTVLAVLCLVKPPNWPVYTVVLVLTVFLHPAIAALMVALGLKDRVG